MYRRVNLIFFSETKCIYIIIAGGHALMDHPVYSRPFINAIPIIMSHSGILAIEKSLLLCLLCLS